MAYIGAEPLPGQNREVDDISSSFNGSTTAFTLQVNGLNTSPETANNILVNIGGVIQNPGTDYTIAASTITFTTAPAAGLSFFAIILGAGINTATVADQTIGTSKVLDNAITADKLAHTSVTAGSYTTADITVDAQGRITAAANGTIATAEIADQAITNAKVNNSAAIAASKIADFVTGNTNNRVLTATGTANSLNGEANLTFDGNNLLLNSASGNVLFGETTAYNTFENGSTNPKLQVRGTNLNGSCQAWIRATADAGAPKLFIANTRNTSSNGHTIVQSGDELGGLFFTGSDGSQFVNGASIAATVTGTPGADDMPGALVFGTNAGAAATTERMRIDKDGNVGINTTSPSQSLEVNGNISLGNGGGSGGSEMLRIFNDSGVERIHATNNPSGLAFGIGGTGSANEAFRIDTGERVLIGITAPPSTGTSGTESAKLQVGISGTSGTAVGFMDTGGFDTNVMVMNHARAGANSGAFSGVMIQFRNSSNTTVGGISSGASTTTYSTSSDYRLKENEVLISDGITRLKQLKPYRFNFKVTPNITQDGFFAHEAQTVVPQAVTGTKDGMRPETYYEEGEDLPSGKVVGSVKTYSSTEIDIQQLDYSQLVPLLTAALQEAVTKIETLETKVAALEAA